MGHIEFHTIIILKSVAKVLNSLDPGQFIPIKCDTLQFGKIKTLLRKYKALGFRLLDHFANRIKENQTAPGQKEGSPSVGCGWRMRLV